eukprot:jgi/Mesvir1/3139/Mv16310-RA.1
MSRGFGSLVCLGPWAMGAAESSESSEDEDIEKKERVAETAHAEDVGNTGVLVETPGGGPVDAAATSEHDRGPPTEKGRSVVVVATSDEKVQDDASHEAEPPAIAAVTEGGGEGSLAAEANELHQKLATPSESQSVSSAADGASTTAVRELTAAHNGDVGFEAADVPTGAGVAAQPDVAAQAIATAHLPPLAAGPSHALVNEDMDALAPVTPTQASCVKHPAPVADASAEPPAPQTPDLRAVTSHTFSSTSPAPAISGTSPAPAISGNRSPLVQPSSSPALSVPHTDAPGAMAGAHPVGEVGLELPASAPLVADASCEIPVSTGPHASQEGALQDASADHAATSPAPTSSSHTAASDTTPSTATVPTATARDVCGDIGSQGSKEAYPKEPAHVAVPVTGGADAPAVGGVDALPTPAVGEQVSEPAVAGQVSREGEHAAAVRGGSDGQQAMSQHAEEAQEEPASLGFWKMPLVSLVDIDDEEPPSSVTKAANASLPHQAYPSSSPSPSLIPSSAHEAAWSPMRDRFAHALQVSAQGGWADQPEPSRPSSDAGGGGQAVEKSSESTTTTTRAIATSSPDHHHQQQSLHHPISALTAVSPTPTPGTTATPVAYASSGTVDSASWFARQQAHHTAVAPRDYSHLAQATVAAAARGQDDAMAAATAALKRMNAGVEKGADGRVVTAAWPRGAPLAVEGEGGADASGGGVVNDVVERDGEEMCDASMDDAMRDVSRRQESEELQTEVWLLRHGEGEHQKHAHVVGGRCPEAQLTARGRDEARALGLFLARFAHMRPHQVVSSPLIRALDTARIVCKELGWPDDHIETDESLQEMSMGAWEGEARSTHYTVAMQLLAAVQHPDFHAPDGESQRDVETRMMQVMLKLACPRPESHKHAPGSSSNTANGPVSSLTDGLDTAKGLKEVGGFPAVPYEVTADGRRVRRVLVFSHGMAIKCLLRGMLHFSPQFTRHVNIDTCSATVVRFAPRVGWELVKVNDTSARLLLDKTLAGYLGPHEADKDHQ